MTDTAPLIISISGIRGIVDESLTPQVVQRFATAFARWLKPGARVILARDTRPSGGRFAEVAARALQEQGCQVLDLGPSTTPTAKLMVLELKADGALILTASHNPASWNGLKLIRGDGIFLNADQAGAVEALYHSGGSSPLAEGDRATREPVDAEMARQHHLRRLRDHVDMEAVRNAGLTATVDLCNGAGGLLIPQLLEELGVNALCLNAEPNGQFAHDPEPVPENLTELSASVSASGSAIGFAVDPDADRVALVDENGRVVGEDYTLGLAVQARTARRRGPVVTTLSTSQTVSDAATANGCPIILTPVGEVHVVEAMLEHKALIGGEGNGGVILTEVDPGRDAAVGVALVLEMIAHTGRPLSSLVDALPAYAIEKRKVDCAPERVEAAVQELCGRYSGALVHPVADGSKLYLSGRLECPWIHLRASNTEPIVRILAESRSGDEAKRLCEEAESMLMGEG